MDRKDSKSNPMMYLAEYNKVLLQMIVSDTNSILETCDAKVCVTSAALPNLVSRVTLAYGLR